MDYNGYDLRDVAASRAPIGWTRGPRIKDQTRAYFEAL